MQHAPMGWNISLEECKQGREIYGFQNCVIPMGGIEERVREYCQENSITYIDIYRKFLESASSSDTKLFYPRDGHWNENGHQVVAETIYQTIMAND